MKAAERATHVAFARPDIGEREIAAVTEVLRSGWLTTGPKTKEFEAAFASALGVKHAVMLNSCTAALHLALDAIGLQPGDEVIVPTLTFASTANVVTYFGARPVLVDVRSDHNIDPAAVEAAMTAKTKAVIPVHFAGMPADMDEIVSLAKARGINVVDDAAHSFPGAYRGRAIGTLADISCFSFYAVKTITTGEGGAAVTANAEWAERMRIMSLHGMAGQAWKRYMAGGKWYYEIEAPGFKYNMTDMAAALGLVQLDRTQEFLAKREGIAKRYDAAFRQFDAYELPPRRPDRSHSYYLYVLKLRPGAIGIGRDQFIEKLGAAGVGTSVHFIPVHTHPYYRETFGYKPEDFPVALDLYQRSISLPIYSRMSESDVDTVIDAVTRLAKS